MQKKKSFLQQQISLSQNSIQKKLTNSIFYNKSIVRGDISNKKIQIIDSFDDYTFENKIFKEVGFSIASFTYFFTINNQIICLIKKIYVLYMAYLV